MEATTTENEQPKQVFTIDPKNPNIREMLDSEGNRIIATDRGNVISLDLKLKNEKKRRHVGDITKSTRTFFIVRRRGEHLHIKSNSYGFNYKIIEMSRLFDTIVIQDEHDRFRIKRQDILDNPNYLFFKQQGFELQTFLSLQQLRQFSHVYALTSGRTDKPIF